MQREKRFVTLVAARTFYGYMLFQTHGEWSAPLDDVWQVVRDPYHLPRWWPRVQRVEGVTDEHFTEVLTRSDEGGYLIAAADLVPFAQIREVGVEAYHRPELLLEADRALPRHRHVHVR